MKLKRWLVVLVMGVIAIFGIMPRVANAATREENIQKIRVFLNDAVVKENLKKKHGASSDKILKSLDSLSDSQIEKLAQNANLQVGGKLDSNSSEDTFWTIYKWYLIGSLVLTLVLVIALA